MFYVEKSFFCEIEVKKSTFKAYLVSMDEFKTLHEKLKKDHPKAAHIVWAYRRYNQFEQIEENSSDDGEPKGTSGPPCLNVLRGAELVECGVLIVRYFGGIKLGTGGLVRAYSSSVNEVIKAADLLPFEKRSEMKFYIPYTLIQRFEHFFKTHDFQAGEKNFDENGVMWSINVTQSQKDDFSTFTKEFEFLGYKDMFN